MLSRIIVHVRYNENWIPKKNQKKHTEHFDTLSKFLIPVFISRSLVAWGWIFFCSQSLNTVAKICSKQSLNFIDHFNVFWGHRELLGSDGLHPNRADVKILLELFYSLCHPCSSEQAEPEESSRNRWYLCYVTIHHLQNRLNLGDWSPLYSQKTECPRLSFSMMEPIKMIRHFLWTIATNHSHKILSQRTWFRLRRSSFYMMASVSTYFCQQKHHSFSPLFLLICIPSLRK